ncbi:hypothetical protein GQ53DRAFT_764130 [Thozetella sp. PMI_491]|nr:hypothetical protein GQ53DRAFT_764130 [Thozetella sp. PMI_491]
MGHSRSKSTIRAEVGESSDSSGRDMVVMSNGLMENCWMLSRLCRDNFSVLKYLGRQVEIFLTVFRGTYWGLAVASGKLGALVVWPLEQLTRSDRDAKQLSGMLIAFGIIMVIIAVIAGTVPDEYLLNVHKSENSTLKIKTLEEITPNPSLKELLADEASDDPENNGATVTPAPVPNSIQQNGQAVEEHSGKNLQGEDLDMVQQARSAGVVSTSNKNEES